MYTIHRTNSFKKSFKKILRHSDFKIEVFEYIIEKLKSKEPLEAKFLDHKLSGKYSGYRECHIQNDILLIYKYEEDVLWLVLADIGSHSQLF